ncbi:MAG TPA: TIGR03619 family F420-dependent LLM class oxidoreductase, partial [Roseiflexaceae bacterium]|nr:TIGR03619 family F420-dependent LLM class oxidoreductase [Roseiflexaceae bacterium]
MNTERIDGVTLGLVLPPFDEPARIYAAARMAETHHFHSVWAPDATLPGYPWLDSLAVLGGVVAVTNRVQVGTSIFVLARRNPVLLAHSLATLDYLSSGRFILGVGVGERALRENEFAIAGVPIEQRGRITQEYLGLLQRLFTESAVTHDGTHFQAEAVTIEPKPVRPGGIPFWIGGRTEASLRRAAALGAAWIPALVTPDDFRQGWGQLGEYVFAAGRDPQNMTGAIHVFASIGTSYEAAVSVLAPAIEAILRAPFAHFASFCIVGTADDWVEQIGRFADAGVRHVNVLLYTQDLLGDVQKIG